jgi:hypothetical protein
MRLTAPASAMFPIRSDTMTRPDVVVVRGRAAIVVSGDKAHDLLTACGVVMAPTFAGWQAPVDDVPRLRAHEARGWTLVEHGGRPT